MGTRNLISVIKDGQPVVAQYGQWDGYPDGQGLGVLEFLNSGLLNSFKDKLSKIRFLDPEGVDKDFVTRFDSDKRTEADDSWFDNFISRDLGSKVLKNITDSKLEEIILRDMYEFGNDTISCEYAYTINLDDNTFTIQNDFTCEPLKVYNLDNLPDKDSFLKDLE